MHVNPATVGTLEGAELARALRHARGCDACRTPVERVLLATRVLEQGTPWEPTSAEIDAATESGLDAAIGAARPRRRWPVLAGMGVALAAAASVFLFVAHRPPEFTARGTGDAGAVLRMFCVPAAGAMREVPSGGRCPRGSQLAFAAGAAPGVSSVALRVGPRVFGPFPLTGQPGAETPLDLTPTLDAPVGALEVTAAFAATPEEALAALRGERVRGAVVRRQEIQVEAIR